MKQYQVHDLGQALFDEAGDALFLFDPETEQLLDANPTAQRLSGCSRDQLLSMQLTYLFRSQAQGGLTWLRQAARKTGLSNAQEGYYLRCARDGIWVPVNLTITRLHVKPKTLGLATARDIREQRAAQTDRQKMEEELRLLMASVSDCLWSAEIDSAGQWAYRYFSPVVEKITGQPPGYFLTGVQRWWSTIHADDRSQWEKALVRLRAGQSIQEEYRVVWPDGTVRWVRDSVMVSRGKQSADGKLQLHGVLTDVTERKQTEDALRENESRLRAVLESVLDCIITMNQEGKITEFNPAAERILGYRRADVLGKELTDIMFESPVDETASRIESNLPRAEGSLLGKRVETRVRRANGSDFPAEMAMTVVRYQGQPVFTVYLRDITDRKRAEEALRESETQFRRAVLGAPFPIMIHAEGGKVLLISKAWTELTGYTPAELPNIAAWTAKAYGESKDRVRADIERLYELSSKVKEGEYMITTRGGETRIWDFSSAPLGKSTDGRRLVISMATDVTDRKHAEQSLRQTADELAHSNQQLHKLAREMEAVALSERRALQELRKTHEELKRAESRLVQSEKLSALGHMVAGVAHEINNPLAFVSSNMFVLRRDVTALHGLLQLYREADATIAAHQPEAHERIRTFSERIDLGYTLDNLETLITRTREGFKRIEGIVNDLRSFARLDEGEVHEADLNAGILSTLNIIRGRAKKENVEMEVDLGTIPPVTCNPAKINQVLLNLLANAVDACPRGGKVTVRSRSNSQGVEIHIIDTGTGIDPAIRDKIFDPFFTTKPQGQGTGLGLSISHGIIADHGGRLEFESTPGQGSHFVVHLPLRPPPANTNSPASTASGSSAAQAHTRR